MPKHFKTFKPSPKPEHRKTPVESLLAEMRDGREYASIIDKTLANPNVREEIQRGITEFEAVRKRPLLIYAANVLKQFDVATGIVGADDLPFAEMVAQIPTEQKSVDVIVVTPGGSGNQVAKFVTALRPRFEHVAFFVPHIAMSAGTIWISSGDEIWMDERAVIGPIDPQVPGRDGQLLPLQALQVLVDEIQRRGEERLKKGENPPWTDLQILRNIDAKELGNAISASEYSIQLTTEFLRLYKFRSWERDGKDVPDQEKLDAARNIAKKLCDHTAWKAHSHGITRDVANAELKLKILHPESVDGVHRAVRRLWALLYWTFDNSLVAKLFISRDFALFRTGSLAGITKP